MHGFGLRVQLGLYGVRFGEKHLMQLHYVGLRVEESRIYGNCRVG